MKKGDLEIFPKVYVLRLYIEDLKTDISKHQIPFWKAGAYVCNCYDVQASRKQTELYEHDRDIGVCRIFHQAK